MSVPILVAFPLLDLTKKCAHGRFSVIRSRLRITLTRGRDKGITNMLLPRQRVGQGERLFHLSVDLAWLLPFGGRPPGWLPGCLAGGLPAVLVRQELLYRRKQSLENSICWYLFEKHYLDDFAVCL